MSSTLYSAWGLDRPKGEQVQDQNQEPIVIDDDDSNGTNCLDHQVGEEIWVDQPVPKPAATAAPRSESQHIHPFFQPRKKAKKEEEVVVTEGPVVNDVSKKQRPKISDAPPHPFFARRVKSEPSKPKIQESCTSDKEELAACWPKYLHVRGGSSYTPRTISFPQKHPSDTVSIEKSFLEGYVTRAEPKYENVFTTNHDCTNKSEIWVNKYKPTSVDSIPYTMAAEVKQWMSTRINKLKSLPMLLPSKKKRKGQKNKADLEGFIVDTVESFGIEQDQEQEPNMQFLILTGGTATCKTATVHAAAQELNNAYVFEVNSGSRRSSGDLMEILDGISQSHLVHEMHRDVVLLFEEVDILFEDEKTFWNGVQKFAGLSRRPIIITCDSLRAIPERVAQESVVAEFGAMDQESKVKILRSIAFKEQKPVTDAIINHLSHFDIKHAINSLQFICCANTYTVPAMNTTTDDPELKSVADVLENRAQSVYASNYTTTTDKMTMYSYSSFPVPEAEEYELQPLRDYVEHGAYSQDLNRQANELRTAMYFLSFGPANSTYNSIDFAHAKVLGSQIAPYVRQMVAADKVLARENESIKSSMGKNGRATRRAHASLGLYDRHFDPEYDEDLQEILDTGICTT